MPRSDRGTPPDEDPGSSHAIGRALEEFERERACGLSPSIADHCARHPAMASELEQALSALVEIGELTDSLSSLSGPRVPSTLGPYRIGEEIGRGGAGRVHRAHDERCGRVVAVKILHPEPAATATRRLRFVREARALASLSHPNVVKIFDVGEDGRHAYYAMELLAGSLDDRIEPAGGARSGERLQEAVAWTIQAADGLAHAHRSGIFHRDVKPSNLLFGTDGRVRVADFGLARTPGGERLTVTGHAVGTLAYAAPEQLRGGDADALADVHGLAATLHALIVGAPPPPEGADFGALPQSLRKVMARALEPRPAERTRSMDVFASELRAVARRLGRRRARRLALAGLVACVGVVVLAAELTRRESPGLEAPSPLPGAEVLFIGDADGFSFLRRSNDLAETSLYPADHRRHDFARLHSHPTYERSRSFHWSGRDHELRLATTPGGDVVELHESGRLRARAALGELAPVSPSGWRLHEDVLDVDGDGSSDVVLIRGDELLVLRWRERAWGGQSGWDARLPSELAYGSPVVLDWDGDDQVEVLLGDTGFHPRGGAGTPRLHELSARDGSPRRSWPLASPVHSTPQFARDASGKIIALYVDTVLPNSRSYTAPDAPTVLHRLAAPGDEEPQRVTLPDGSGGRFTWPVFQELTGDGREDVLIGRQDGIVHAISSEGRLLWSHDVGASLISYPILSNQDADPDRELCVAVGGSVQCLKTAQGVASRMAWSIELPGSERFVSRLTELGDLDGDGLAELVVFSSSGRMRVFSRAIASGVLHDVEAFDQRVDVGPAVVARPVILDAGEARRIVAVSCAGVVSAWTVGPGVLHRDWQFRIGANHVLTASPVPLRLRRRDGSEADAVLVASDNGWMLLLAVPADGDPPIVEWSLRVPAAIAGTPAVRSDAGGTRVFFATGDGTVRCVPLPRQVSGT